jgi:hypothetical protein
VPLAGRSIYPGSLAGGLPPRFIPVLTQAASPSTVNYNSAACSAPAAALSWRITPRSGSSSGAKAASATRSASAVCSHRQESRPTASTMSYPYSEHHQHVTVLLERLVTPGGAQRLMAFRQGHVCGSQCANRSKRACSSASISANTSKAWESIWWVICSRTNSRKGRGERHPPRRQTACSGWPWAPSAVWTSPRRECGLTSQDDMDVWGGYPDAVRDGAGNVHARGIITAKMIEGGRLPGCRDRGRRLKEEREARIAPCPHGGA